MLHINFREKGRVNYLTTDIINHCGKTVAVRDIHFGYPTSVLIIGDEKADIFRRGDWLYAQKRIHQSAMFNNDEITVFISDFATDKFVRDLFADELKGVASYVG